jgi:hypothetical protein
VHTHSIAVARRPDWRENDVVLGGRQRRDRSGASTASIGISGGQRLGIREGARGSNRYWPI